MWRPFGQFYRRSIRFRWVWLVVMLASTTLVVLLVGAALFARDNQQEQVFWGGFLPLAALQIGINILALVVGLRFLNGILKSIGDVTETSRWIRDAKDFSRRAASPNAIANCDEIDALIANFNAMLGEIQRREVESSNCNKSLESGVAELTEALSAANLVSQSAKAAAAAATMAKSRFLAAASHDLRQPMFAIELFKDALNKTSLNDEQRRIGNSLSRAIQNLGELLDALLDISKLDTGAITPKSKLIDIHELFSNLDAEFATLAYAKVLRFKLQFPIGNLALVTDGQLLHGLLRNLIGNAIKFTDRGGVLVSLRRRGNQAILQVWDTGVGIAPEHMSSIFEEYFQVGNPERDRAKGLGLGLPLARRQAQLLGTEIVCRSRIGRGSVFEFRLPLADKPPRKDRALIRRRAAGEASTSDLVGRRIGAIYREFEH